MAGMVEPTAPKMTSGENASNEFDDPEFDIERPDITMDSWRAEIVRDLIQSASALAA
jgi:hypothetical protein